MGFFRRNFYITQHHLGNRIQAAYQQGAAAVLTGSIQMKGISAFLLQDFLQSGGGLPMSQRQINYELLAQIL